MLPLTVQQIQLYISYLFTLKYKSSTIVSHLSAISHMHKINQHPDPTCAYATSKMLTGVRNIQGQKPDQRQPITHNILLGLLAALPYCAPTMSDISLFKSMFTLMYYACLRASEVLQTETPQHILHLNNIRFNSNNEAYNITFRSYKHSTNSEHQIVVTSTSTPACPVTALRHYLPSRGPNPGPIYIRKGLPVTRSHFLHVLHACLKYLHLNHSSFNIHSFRIGRTTDMAQQNVPHYAIQQIGRWRSTAFLKYIRPQEITTQPSAQPRTTK